MIQEWNFVTRIFTHYKNIIEIICNKEKTLKFYRVKFEIIILITISKGSNFVFNMPLALSLYCWNYKCAFYVNHLFLLNIYWDIFDCDSMVLGLWKIERVYLIREEILLVKQELLTLTEHLCSPPDFSGVRVTRSLVLCVLLCRSLFVLLSFFFWLTNVTYIRVWYEIVSWWRGQEIHQFVNVMY
jgi:hypothetical protein